LHVTWPADGEANRRNGSGFSTLEGNALLTFALLQPDQLHAAITAAIVSEQPLSAVEHAERMAGIERRITALSCVEAALVERNGGEHDPQAAPQCVLGARVGNEVDAAA
jgi:hypothetical protein